jgi:hypothetical protein
MIPIQSFGNDPSLAMTLEEYKRWYRSLVDFAKELQNPLAMYY